MLRSLVSLVLGRSGMTIAGIWWPWSDSLVRELPAVDVAISASLLAVIARLSLRLGDLW